MEFIRNNNMEFIRINFKGVEFEVEFDYQPSEPEVRYYSDGSGYPGCPEAVEGINSFTHKGTCFLEIAEDYYDEIAEAILNKMHEE